MEYFRISIHAPAKGATKINLILPDFEDISIHAPAKGATGRGKKSELLSNYFNPRSREGSDTSNYLLMTRLCNFNPRSREGSDKDSLSISCNVDDFNPRSREGSDPTRMIVTPAAVEFQSTLPRRERQSGIHSMTAAASISIHAPAKGATNSIQ